MYSGKIIRINPNSLAEELGLREGDMLLEINEQRLRDIIDFSFAFAGEEINMLIEHSDGAQEMISFEKEYDEELGVEFESAVFDGIRRCANKCCFCFVDQIAPNMRANLSVKDDDYRMSFLYGNFVTMTNMSDADFNRIRQYHLSPLFVSVHTMDSGLRQRMLGCKRAGDIAVQLDHLEKAGVEYHTQIVLCPGLNDGDELDKTIDAIVARKPYAQSLAIVPVGLTKYRDDCYPLTMFDAQGAGKVIDQVEIWQEKQRKLEGRTFVYLSDEFYFLAGRDIPPAEHYDGFPQLDNGIGLARNFIEEWKESALKLAADYEEPVYLDVISGTSIAPLLENLIAGLELRNLNVRVLPVVNHFFGKTVNVSGLLTGQDILDVLKNAKGRRTGVILPESALRAGENIFLDDYSLENLRREIAIPIRTALSGAELWDVLAHWENFAQTKEDETVYMWQSNAAYTKPARRKSDKDE